MDFVHSVKQAIDLIKLYGKIAAKVSKDKNATLVGLLIVAIGGFLAVIGRFDTRLSSLVLMPITAIILLFIGVGIMHVFASIWTNEFSLKFFGSIRELCTFVNTLNSFETRKSYP